MTCSCFIIPSDVLTRLASDQGLPNDVRQSLLNSAQISAHFRALREQHNALSLTAMSLTLPRPPVPPVHAAPQGLVYNCQHHTSLPGVPVSNPGRAADQTA